MKTAYLVLKYKFKNLDIFNDCLIQFLYKFLRFDNIDIVLEKDISLLDLNFMNIKQEGAIAWCEDIPSALKAIGL